MTSFLFVLLFFTRLFSRTESLSDIYFKFKPLIGLPKFIRLHVMVAFDDPITEESFTLDFLPIDAANPEIMSKIILGNSSPGEIRIKKLELNGTVDKIGERKGEEFANMLTSGFDPSLNLYFNNCYHFAFHCLKRQAESRKMCADDI